MASASAPFDEELRRTIETTARFVSRNGEKFEAMTLERNAGDPKFDFLRGGEGASYYRDCVREFSAPATPSGRPVPPAGGMTAAELIAKLAQRSASDVAGMMNNALQSVPHSEKQSFMQGASSLAPDSAAPAPQFDEPRQSEASVRSERRSSSAKRPPPPPPGRPERVHPSPGHRPSRAVSKEGQGSKFYAGVMDAVKHALKEPWKRKELTREAFKAICKTVSDKVLQAEQKAGSRLPESKEELKEYFSPAQPALSKIRKLVDYYVRKHKGSNAPQREV